MYKKRKKKGKRPTRAEFEYQYYGLDLTAEEMADIYKVRASTIYNWATQFRKEEIKTP